MSNTSKFTPSEAKCIDNLMEVFHLVKELKDSAAVKETIMLLLKQSYPEEFVEVENLQLNYSDRVGYEGVV